MPLALYPHLLPCRALLPILLPFDSNKPLIAMAGVLMAIVRYAQHGTNPFMSAK